MNRMDERSRRIENCSRARRQRIWTIGEQCHVRTRWRSANAEIARWACRSLSFIQFGDKVAPAFCRISETRRHRLRRQNPERRIDRFAAAFQTLRQDISPINKRQPMAWFILRVCRAGHEESARASINGARLVMIRFDQTRRCSASSAASPAASSRITFPCPS